MSVTLIENSKFVKILKQKRFMLDTQIASLYWPSVGPMLSFLWAQCRKITSVHRTFDHRRIITPTRWRDVGPLSVDWTVLMLDVGPTI